IEEELTKMVHLAQVNNTTSCVADELKPDTEYVIKVRAWSVAGKGGWSDVFKGHTLPSLDSRGYTPYALVSTKEGLLKTDIGGKFLFQLIARFRINAVINCMCNFTGLNQTHCLIELFF